ncbi:hypothetical protein BYT27DRAFT_7165184 [Phlegmacium glaucopus]|nr:hypothetical protein BYT27DRAFT_7165184 [Phlegmacium glaucopus]
MQGSSSLPPPHPSLPRQPITFHQTAHDYSVPSYYNSHYLQAYSQASSNASVTSSLAGQNSQVPIPNFTSVNNNPASGASKLSFLDSKSSWYQGGNNRCKQQGCAFFGSHKSVEIHMMDRHLIYPPDWGKRNKKPVWDADPSLKGKPIPIQGTNIVLDSPEVLDAWIAERKKRFPTSSRVEEKKRKYEDAVARGQLDITGATLRSNKRQKCDHRLDGHGSHQKSNTGKNGRDQTRTTDAGWGGRVRAAPITPSRVVPVSVIEASHSSSSSEDDTDGKPEVLSSKVQRASELPIVREDKEDREKKKSSDALAPSQSVAKNNTVGRSSFASQPKNPPRNPFASRPTLLRNLLLPEISITVSNLSQAIRFLVDNDFLQNVELSPGQALDQKSIEVLDS